MNYERIYNEFIADRRVKEADLIASGEYKERHHIVPRSMGGSDDAENLIALTAGDHFKAHYLLAEAHGGRQWFSVVKMVEFSAKRHKRESIRKDVECFALMYSKAKGEYSKAASELFSGDKNPAFGKTNEKNPNARKVMCVETGVVFSSMASAKDWCGVAVNRACSLGIRAGGYHWKRVGSESPLAKKVFKRPIQEANKRGGINRIGVKNGNARSIVNLTTGEAFNTIKEALVKYGIKGANMSAVLGGRTKTAGGYRWAFAA